MYLSWRELIADIAYGLGLLVAAAITLVFGYAAILCWLDVLDGLASVNGSGGSAIVCTFLAGFMGTMTWIATKR
jgi:hypothetical protein